MKFDKYILTVLILVISKFSYSQQEVRDLTLDDAIEIARQQSPDALKAKHTFRASYWQYRSYKASYLPSLVLSGYIPDFNKSISRISTTDGSVFSEISENWLYAGVSLNQRIGLTGGTLSLNSDLARLDNFIDDSTSYSSNLLNIKYQQPIFQYNPYKWERKLEPMKYNEAKMKYLEEMEEVSLNATNHFFNLLLAQIKEKIAEVNAANYDTLYKIAQGRYNLGKIAENDLLQLELQYLRSGAEVENARLEVENQMFRFKSFLRIKDEVDINLISPYRINPFTVIATKALEQARQNNSEALAFNRRLIEAESEVAYAKLNGRFDADLFVVYGMSQNAGYISDINKNPSDNRQLRLGITMPLLDWGVAKGKIKMAESNREIVRTAVDQEQIDFDQSVFLKVARFNMQFEQVVIAAKADTVAQKGYNVTKARYLIGKISITDLNIAQTEADNSRSNYFSSLWTYWRNYYDLRRLTLYDFERDIPIVVDYKELL
ncbi:MAG: hypothetical protein B6D61_01080 [Bacteroidetes bacterium 4484_249]|nr:MAG: hypothetical protein B6D61_01080 [Bacteroidetes bacterium 4484_249]